MARSDYGNYPVLLFNREWFCLAKILSTFQVYEKATCVFMWIVNPGMGEGSGVLFDKHFKFAATNAHITGTQNTVEVYFLAPNEMVNSLKTETSI